MSLASLTKAIKIWNPSTLVSIGEDQDSVRLRTEQKAKNEGLFCPHCFYDYGIWIPVSFVKCSDKRDHFRHKQDSQDRKCSNHPMTEKHINGQSWLAEKLQQKYPNSQVVTELRLKNEEANRRPDICVIHADGSMDAHELQISSIAAEKVKQKTLDLITLGCKRVFWYFTQESIGDTIKKELAKTNQYCYIVDFSVKDYMLIESSIQRIDLTAIRQAWINEQMSKLSHYKSLPARYQNSFKAIISDEQLEAKCKIVADTLNKLHLPNLAKSLSFPLLKCSKYNEYSSWRFGANNISKILQLYESEKDKMHQQRIITPYYFLLFKCSLLQYHWMTKILSLSFCEELIGSEVTYMGERHTILSIMPRHVTMVNSQEKRVYVAY